EVLTLAWFVHTRGRARPAPATALPAVPAAEPDAPAGERRILVLADGAAGADLAATLRDSVRGGRVLVVVPKPAATRAAPRTRPSAASPPASNRCAPPASRPRGRSARSTPGRPSRTPCGRSR